MKIIVFSFILIFAFSCGSASKVNELRPGMSSSQVREKFGEPDSTQFIQGKYIEKYTLFKPWQGQLPYYLIYDSKGEKLEQWFMNEQEFRANQAAWGQAIQGISNQMQQQQQMNQQSQEKNNIHCTDLKDYQGNTTGTNCYKY